MGMLEQHVDHPWYQRLASTDVGSNSINLAASAEQTFHPLSAQPKSMDTSSMVQQLQMSASRLPLLRSVMEHELQALTPNSPQLQLAQHIQQQRSTPRMQPQQQQGSPKQLQVVPLLGLSLEHLLRTSSAQGSSVDNACFCATGRLGPAQVHAAMLQHSPFLTALQAELHFLHKASGSCYTQIKEHLASVGKYLPPAADASGRRSSTGSNRPTDPASPDPSDSPTSSSNARSDSYYGKGLDLQMLQQQADAGALDLIHLEDCIGSNVANLAKLAQQYDIMITAALAAAGEHADTAAAAAGAAPAPAPAQQDVKAASRKGSFLGPLFGALRGKHAGSKAGQQQADAVEYVFMKPGVCSHSNEAQTYSYRAGVPLDVYSTSTHRLLSHSDSCERVLWMLSVIYARLRFAADAAAAAAVAMGAPVLDGGVKQWRAPDMFTRSTTKYWVHPSNILRLKLALTKQLPLLVYGADDPVSSGDIGAVAAGQPGSKDKASGQHHKVTSLVSSVYFDGPDLPVYHTRLARLDGARLVRIRYYGQRVTGPAGAEQSVFVEQKTHRDKIMGETSYKERASMQQGQMPPFLSRQVPLEDLLGPNSKKLEMLGDIQNFLAEANQAPVMRTEYMRSAWQAYDDNAVRFSFDEDMLLLREGAVSAGNNSSWCSPLESQSQLPFSDAVRFPYGILEIKLQDKEAAPAWVHELKTSGVIIEVPKFSKFLHGMALLQPEKIREVPSWFAWREAEGVTLPASMDEMWDMTAERRARKELEWQERLEAEDPAALAAANTPEVTAMLMLLRAPRVYASSAAAADIGAIALTAVEDPASKPALSAAPSYDLTASAATAPAGQPDALAFAQQAPAAAGATATWSVQRAAGLHSYPCHAPSSNLASTSTNSSNSANSGSAGIHAEQLHGPARDIMEDGQFGYAGGMHSGTNNRSSSSNGLYRGSGGCMQPGLGLVALPGRSDSFSCSRGPTAHMVDSPTMDSPSEATGLNGSSPSFGAQPLSVRVIMPHSRSLSSSSLASSDLHATGSSSSLGPDALPHFTTYSSPAHSLLHSPTQPGSHYGSLQHADSVAGYPRVHLAQQPAHGHRTTTSGSAGRPHSRDSSSGGTCDSWKLSTVNPLFSAGPLARSSATGGAACSTGLHGDSAYKPAPGRSMKESLWATGSPEVRRGWRGGHDQDGAPLGPVRGDDVVLDLSKLAAQAANPSAALAAAALAAGAGRPQVIQVHYTGAVEAVPVPAHASPTPSPHQVRELAQLLPPAAPAASNTAVVAALAPADAEVGRTDQLIVDGIAADSAGKDVSRKGSRGYRQRMQQWKASFSGRMRGMRGSRGASSASMAPSYSMRSNEHMLGFAGTGPRQPAFVKARADPKTFFANERTFLQWLQISVLVMMTGLGMLTGSTLALNGNGGSCMSNVLCSASRISGAIIAPVSILFMIYAIYLYQKRTKQLLTCSTLRYDDARGPWILTILLILVTVVVIVLALEAFKVSVQT